MVFNFTKNSQFATSLYLENVRDYHRNKVAWQMESKYRIVSQEIISEDAYTPQTLLIQHCRCRNGKYLNTLH